MDFSLKYDNDNIPKMILVMFTYSIAVAYEIFALKIIQDFRIPEYKIK